MNRGVWQLKSLLVRFCDHGGSSAGVRCDPLLARAPPRRLGSAPHRPGLRAHHLAFHTTRACCRHFLEKQLVPFAEANPQIDICVSKRPNRHPFVRGWYLRDHDKQLSLKNLSMEQMLERVQFLRDMRPVGLNKFAKPFRTSPSVQGEWRMGQLLDREHVTIRSR